MNTIQENSGYIVMIMISVSLIIGGVLLLIFSAKFEVKDRYISGIVFLLIGIIGLIFFHVHNAGSLWGVLFTTQSIEKQSVDLFSKGQFVLLTALVTSTLTLIVISGRFMDRMTDLETNYNLKVVDKKEEERIYRKHRTYSGGYTALNFVIIIQMFVVWLLLIRIAVFIMYSLEVFLFDEILILLILLIQGIVWPVFFYWITYFCKSHTLHKELNLC